MVAYLAMNGNDATGEVYEQEWTAEQLRSGGVKVFQTFQKANAALQPWRGKAPLKLVDLGYMGKLPITQLQPGAPPPAVAPPPVVAPPPAAVPPANH